MQLVDFDDKRSREGDYKKWPLRKYQAKYPMYHKYQVPWYFKF